MPIIEVNGLDYFYHVQGSGLPLLLLHGFTGSSESWTELLDPFADCFKVVLLDLPGHGRTAVPSTTGGGTIEAVSRDLIAIISALQLASVNLLGYSMVGRLALYTAARHPEFIKSLIFESASPGLETTAQRQVRIESDDQLANEIERTGIPAFVDRWQELSLFDTQKGLSAKQQQRLRHQRLSNSASGLTRSLRGMGTGRQPSMWHELESIHLPVLILAGESDRKYVNIAQQLAATLPRADLRIIAESGHNIHLEKTHLFASIVLDFIEDVREADLD